MKPGNVLRFISVKVIHAGKNWEIIILKKFEKNIFVIFHAYDTIDADYAIQILLGKAWSILLSLENGEK